MEENESKHMFLATEFRTKLLTDVQNCLKSRNIACDKICVVKRVRDLHDGDYCVPKGCLPKVTNEILEEICEELKESNTNHHLKLCKVTTSKHFGLTFYLERPLTFKSTLVPFWENGISLSSFCDVGNGAHVLVASSDWHSRSSGDLEDLRSIVVLEHVTHLLKGAGYCVEAVRCCQQKKSSPDLLDITIPSIALTGQMSVDCKDLVKTLVVNNSYCKGSHQSFGRCDSDVPCKHVKLGKDSSVCAASDSVSKPCGMDKETGQQQTKVILNLQRFVEDKQLPVGKDGYDKNLKFSELYCGEDTISETLKEAYLLHEAIGKLQKHGTSTVVHIVPDSAYFSQQRVDLTTRTIWPEEHSHKQVYLVHGPVKARRQTQANVKTATDFVQLRFSQMKSAAVMKYGEEVNGPGWQSTISVLTSAGIKFEMLSTVSRSTVKLDLSEGESGAGSDTRTGSFVMYNCARLTTLFKHFEESVGKGQYPPLPNIADVDFSLLRDEDEWSLFFLYIFPYPDLIRETVEELVPKAGGISAKIHTHKICNLLISFSHSLSSYYSRIHILGENRPHLLPLMYARLYFMKIVYKVLSHALRLLGVEPMSQL
ncbi:DALR anticodon-binding domain-containing protein 3-like [Mizuhopecten yessoensis]|uniref:DALR anticodon-binding domain-containing protein 3 n=1 Tax=Mizuhopecten yessoensis TaxID=6573 RepID=A0A210R3U8_MIZYE|nr:DALR anticodon-binding domain-containing protein 3-like [Mizuhopecten yessoensis]OWF55604.1 DALR anticodon-binding domain-containing protein 3 [Mizuhopecten yessoensis]